MEKEKEYPACIGSKIRSKGMGRGLGIGKGRGPIYKRTGAERNIEKTLGLKKEPEVGIFEEISTEDLKKIMREN